MPAELNPDTAEISLADIVNFLADSWKKLVLAAVTGGVLGLVGWFVLVPFSAQLPLINNAGLNVLSLKALQQTLPNLASQILKANGEPKEQKALYQTMANPLWWPKALIPTYNLTKADIKDLGADMKEGSNRILFLTVSGSGPSKEAATQNAQHISDFIKQGGAYLALEAMLRGQEAQLVKSDAEISSKINTTIVDLEYQKARLKNLEALAVRFPNESRSATQVVDPKDSGAKYLLLSTQIIAINTDINASTEGLLRLRDAQQQLGSLKIWVEKARPIVDASFNGLAINQDLLALEKEQRALIALDNPKALAFLDGVQVTLLNNEAQFKSGLIENGATTANKAGRLKWTAGGLAAALFLMLLALLTKKVLAGMNRDDNAKKKREPQ